MNDHTLKRIQFQLDYLKDHRDSLVIDTDTHPTDLNILSGAILERYQATSNYYHGRPISTEELILEMDLAGVDMALSWQNPAAITYTTDLQENFELLLRANKYIFESAEKYPQRIIAAGWTDPKALGLENALKLVDICTQEFGFFIVKMNPAQNSYPIDSDEVMLLVDKIVGLKAIPAFHYGGDTPYTPPEGLAKVASRHPQHPIIAVHMGGGGSHYVHGEEQYLKTRELGLKYPNIVFPISAKRDAHIESDLITYQLAGEPFSRNLFCASDAPYGRMTWNYGGYQRMFESLMNSKHPDKRIQENVGFFTEESAQNYKGRNFVDFTLKYYSEFLDNLT